MKRVGIITVHGADNYGSVLQAYALQKVVTDLGCEAEIINYRPETISKDYRLLFSWKEIENGLHYGIKAVWRSIILIRFRNLPKAIRKRKYFQKFRNQYLKETRKTRSEMELARLKPYDVYITGSDQLWNPDITNGFDKNYFLDFAPKDARCISYAVSLGVAYDLNQRKEFTRLACRMDDISIREASTQAEVEMLTKKEVALCLDPTLLIAAQEWESMAKDSGQEDYILYYSLHYTPQQLEVVNWLSARCKCPVKHFFYGRLSKRIERNGGMFYYDGPQEFLGLVRGARMVVTDSYHGTIFSILFQKDFYAFETSVWGIRITDLLKQLGLKERLIEQGQNTSIVEREMEQRKEINYKSVFEKIEQNQMDSMEYLKKNLDGR